MSCDCNLCKTVERWESALNIKTPEAREVFEEILKRLEAAETDAEHARLVFTGKWPGSVKILEAALKIAKELNHEST